MKTKKIFFNYIFFVFVTIFNVQSQDIKGDLPFIQNYTTDDYGQHSQNWGVVENSDGIVYFANNNGIVTYDGNKWGFVELHNQSSASYVANDSNGTIYTGGELEFGYLKKDEKGKINYISISENLTEKYSDFYTLRRIFATNDGIIYQYDNYIFVYLNNKVSAIKFDGEFGLSFYINNIFYIFVYDTGLMKLENNELVIVENGEAFIDSYIYALFNYDNDNMIIADRINGISLYNKNTGNIEIITSDASDFLVSNNVYCGLKIDDNKFAFGTLQSGVILINNKFEIIQKLTKKSGLNDKSILSMNTGNNNNLWLCLSDGISYVVLNSHLSRIDETCGIEGIVSTTAFYNQKLYIGTTLGVYMQNSENEFEKLNGFDGECWHIDTCNTDLLSCQYNGLFKINGKVEKIALDATVWNFIKPNFAIPESYLSKKILYVGDEYGLHLIEIENNKYIYKNKIEGIDFCRWMAEDSDGYLWIIDEYAGVFRFRLNSTGDSLIDKKIYDSKSGLPADYYNYIFKNNDINSKFPFFIGTISGIYCYDSSNDIFTEYSEYNQYLREKLGTYPIVSDKSGNYYFQSGKEIAKINPNSTEIFNSSLFNKFSNSIIENIIILNQEAIMFTTKDGIIKYNSTLQPVYNLQFNTYIRNCTVKNGDSLNIFKDSEVVIDYQNNSLNFRISADYFENSDKTQFSYYLEGFDNKWSDWSLYSEKQFTNLYEGKYILHVKSKNVYGIEGTEISFSFRILSPWYRTALAYIFYIIAAAFFVYFIVKLNSRRLNIANKKLEATVKQRTMEILQQKEEIQAQAEELLTLNETLQNQAEQLRDYSGELEKLSIVASETDNSVFIMDAKGVILWINKGFTKMYGFTTEEFLAKYQNIFQISSNPEINDTIENCLQSKSTIVYESVTKSKSGIDIYAQTTITPILDEDGKIVKLIAIDSDIRKLKEAERIITQKNDQITSSIRYAHTIQQAILPFSDKIPFEHFIIYRPKDIVSGDFYWFTSINNQKTAIEKESGFTHFLAVVDCTGHGVPGAFMSMIGSRLLNEIVNERSIFDTDLIVEKLDELINISLQQQQSENNDGMDLSLIKIEKTNNQNIVSFTGAKNSALFISCLSREVNVLKGDRRSVGGRRKVRSEVLFTSTKVEVLQNDVIYLFSDGIIDQNNKERKRFGSKKLIKIISENFEKALSEQKYIIEKEIDTWQSGVEQRDDISLIGIRF